MMDKEVEKSLAMRDLDLDSRPREKATTLGFQALSPAELLASIIGSGTPGENVSVLCQRILSDHDNKLYNLARCSINDLCNNYKGIGKVKAIKFLATLELARRYQQESLGDRFKIRNAEDAYRYIKPKIADLPNEVIDVILLNRRKEVIHWKRVSSGGVSFSLADVKMVLKPAIEYLADGMILTHNHPSDNPNPSTADDNLTAKVKAACTALDIQLVDHIIVCRGGKYYSYVDEGRL